VTKEFLCICAALGTTVVCAQAAGESLETEGPATIAAEARLRLQTSQEKAAEQAARVATRPHPKIVAGWQVVARVDDNQPPILATQGKWTIVADSRKGDHLVGPRVIGPDLTMWATSATLFVGGVALNDLVVVSHGHLTRAAHARLTLEPANVEMVDVGPKVERAE
jgi:hypothetical protein